MDDMAEKEQFSGKKWETMFRENTKQIDLVPECANLWVSKARLMMLDDHPEQHERSGLDEIERCILHALELASEHSEALEEAANFYDVMVPDREKAVRYAQHYIQIAGRGVPDMQAIVDNSN
jgi:hypothetical protein